MKHNWKFLPVVIVGVAIGTLITAYIVGMVVQKKLDDTTNSTGGRLLGLLK